MHLLKTDACRWLERLPRPVRIALAAVVCGLLLAVGGCIWGSLFGGFTDSYTQRIAALQARHPNWTFVPLMVDDLTWDEIVDRERTDGWNLVAYSHWAPQEWRKFGVANYTPYYAANAKAYDSGAWYQASREAIAYFMDPRNFLNDTEVFMFETLDYNPALDTPEAVRQTLTDTFMAGDARCDGNGPTFTDALLNIGRRIDISPVFLAGRLASEQGTKGSPQALGRIGSSLVALHADKDGKVGNARIWGTAFTRDGTNTAAVIAKGADFYDGTYNLFNIGAYGSGLFEIRHNAWRKAHSEEVCARYCGPWTNQVLAIQGGATILREEYVGSCRHTRYLQKFSVAREAGDRRWKQYMQNIAAPLVEARNTAAAYAAAGTLDAPHHFVVPVYRRMPKKHAPDPAHGRSVLSPTRTR